MGMKYSIIGFNYLDNGETVFKQTNWLIVSLFWLIYLSRKYNGVDLEKRD